MIRQRFRTYREQTQPLLDYYRKRGMLESIDGLGAEDEVFEPHPRRPGTTRNKSHKIAVKPRPAPERPRVGLP